MVILFLNTTSSNSSMMPIIICFQKPMHCDSFLSSTLYNDVKLQI